PGGQYLVYEILPRNPVPQRPGIVAAGETGGQIAGQSAGQPRIVVRDLTTGVERAFHGRSTRLSADGSKAVFLATQGEETLVQVVALGGGEPVTVVRTALP